MTLGDTFFKAWATMKQRHAHEASVRLMKRIANSFERELEGQWAEMGRPGRDQRPAAAALVTLEFHEREAKRKGTKETLQDVGWSLKNVGIEGGGVDAW